MSHFDPGDAEHWASHAGEPGAAVVVPGHTHEPRATAADAGTPGDFQPSGCYTPRTLDDMAGVAANPATPWTTGEYMELYHAAGECYWTGQEWADGRAP